MRKAAFGCLLVASVYIMVGCGNNSAVLKEANVEQSVETSKDTDVNNEEHISMRKMENIFIV